MSVIDVHITSTNGQFKPSLDPVTLSKNKGQTIKWHNDTAENLTINFTNGTPFPGNRQPYRLDAGRQVDSGPIEVQENTNWSYDIVAASGAIADPQVIIER